VCGLDPGQGRLGRMAWLARSCIFGLLREHVENKRLIDGQS
jgi:hypothetical protein